MLLALAGLLPLLWLASARPGVGAMARMVDGHTVGALAALMILSRGLEASGALGRLADTLLRRAGSPRGLAATLVLLSAGLAAVLTNDVALFIVVPLTVGLRSRLPGLVGRLVIFEALAVNAGSAASPVGNPQNLFLWNASGQGFVGFTLAMLPLGVALVGLLLALVPLGFPRSWPAAGHPVEAGPPAEARHLSEGEPTLDRRLVGWVLPMYPVVLIMVELGQAVPAALLVGALFLAWKRPVLAGVDWPLLGVFALFFVNVGLLASLPWVAGGVERLLQLPGGAYTAGILVSQGISNVPAALLLEGFTGDWALLAWGVSVGGFGLALGSLANLIALRLAREPGSWLAFHRWSLPILGVAGVGGWILARLTGIAN
jgi:Na+/H+ antiporter NhaD/arsenite permease-like protein